MAFVVFNLLAAAALIGIDQAIKLWATNVLQPIGAMPLIPHVVELRFVLNQGMAFSLLSGKQLFLIIATSACRADRERPVSSPLRKRSIRWPAVSCSTTNSRCSMAHCSFEDCPFSACSSSRKITSTQRPTPTHTQISAKLNTANCMNSRLM